MKSIIALLLDFIVSTFMLLNYTVFNEPDKYDKLFFSGILFITILRICSDILYVYPGTGKKVLDGGWWWWVGSVHKHGSYLKFHKAMIYRS